MASFDAMVVESCDRGERRRAGHQDSAAGWPYFGRLHPTARHCDARMTRFCDVRLTSRSSWLGFANRGAMVAKTGGAAVVKFTQSLCALISLAAVSPVAWSDHDLLG